MAVFHTMRNYLNHGSLFLTTRAGAIRPAAYCYLVHTLYRFRFALFAIVTNWLEHVTRMFAENSMHYTVLNDDVILK